MKSLKFKILNHLKCLKIKSGPRNLYYSEVYVDCRLNCNAELKSFYLTVKNVTQVNNITLHPLKKKGWEV